MPDNPIAVHVAVRRLLQYIGINSLTAPTGAAALQQPRVTDDDKQRALDAINSAIEEIEQEAQGIFKNQLRSAFFRAPQTVTVTAIEGENEIVIAEGAEGWMIGCTIRIAGALALNQIMSTNVLTDEVTLLRAYDGATMDGLVATVYGDTVILPDNVRKLVPPVSIYPDNNLWRAKSQELFNSMKFYGQPVTGDPTCYIDDPIYTPEFNYLPIHLKIWPAPAENKNVDYYCDVAALRVDLDDLGATDDSDPGTEFSSLPAQWPETILMPIAEQYFTKHPAFKNTEAKAEIAREYAEAKRKMQASKLSVSVNTTRASFIRDRRPRGRYFRPGKY